MRRTSQQYMWGVIVRRLNHSGKEPRSARSALWFRAWLASFGFIVCTVGTVAVWRSGHILGAIFLCALALIAVVDLTIVVRRLQRGERG
jgi:hypothetical protein